MSEQPVRVLLIEDNPGDVRLIRELLAEAGAARFEVTSVQCLAAGLEHLSERSADMLLLDLALPDSQGLDTLARVRAQAPEVPIVVLTGLDDEARALRAVQDGAQDFLVKGRVDAAALARAVSYALARKRIGQRLQDSEARKAAILEAALDSIVVVGQGGKITEFNSAAERTFGHTRAEAVGKPMATLLIPPSQRELHRAGVERYRATGRSEYLGRTVERMAMRADGTEFPVELSITPFAASGGSGFLAVLRDITERKRREEELRASEERYRTVVEHANDWIWTLDGHGGFTFINHQAEVASGYRFEDWKGRSFAPLIHPDDLESVVRVFQKTLAGEPQQYVVRVRKANGEWLVLSVNTAPVRQGDEVVGAVGFGRDITEQRALEDQLRQAQKMEAVGQLAGGIAHDFNNLLTTILATTELVSAELPGDSPLREDIQTIRQTASSGAALTRKLLAFSRRQRLEFRDLDLGDLVRDFARMARRLVRADIDIELALDQRIMTVHADAGALEQILMNLVTNARDAMPQGGSLVIHAAPATLDREFCDAQGWGAPGEYPVLAVTDSGIGMDRETQRRVFEPFFTTKPPGVGTGLGMAMVYGLVAQHQGHIDVYSEVGHGTTIKIYLPAVARAAAGLVSPAPAPPVRGGRETILLVEDEESLRRTAKRVLEKHGYAVLSAADGVEALELFHAHEPEIALIVSDVVMPRLSGPQLLAELRQAGKTAKFLFTSGYTARDVEQTKSLEPGLPFLTKPWAITDLLRRVREVLDASPPPPPQP